VEPAESQRISAWLKNCLGDEISLQSARNLKHTETRRIWDCEISGQTERVILAEFLNGPLEHTNASLPPAETVKKCALASAELSRLGIPAAVALGTGGGESGAAIVWEYITTLEWTANDRINASSVLARLHTTPLDSLSSGLLDLVIQSDPRPSRTEGSIERLTTKLDQTSATWRTEHPSIADEVARIADQAGRERQSGNVLVHGDYFSANILPTDDGIRIIDWETFGLGDPEWDLGFLVGADPVKDDEFDAVVHT
jgi:aminoglycoside phosphotransferase (APT) family kinase protein